MVERLSVRRGYQGNCVIIWNLLDNLGAVIFEKQ